MALLHKFYTSCCYTSRKVVSSQLLQPAVRTSFQAQNHKTSVNSLKFIKNNKVFVLLSNWKCFNFKSFPTYIQSRKFSISLVRQLKENKSSLLGASAKVKRDTKLFAYANDRFFKWVTPLGIVQYFMWMYLAGFIYTYFDQLKYQGEVPEGTPGGYALKTMVYMIEHKMILVSLTLLLSNFILFYAYIYPQRTVSALHLLKGGKNLKIETYTHFGRKDSFIRPLDNVCFLQSRTAPGSRILMKVKGKYLFYTLDKDKGYFYNHDLYDFVVGLKRDF